MMRRTTAKSRPHSRKKIDGSVKRNFRFFDNRQRYLMFVNTCSEKEIIARRIGKELTRLQPAPPAIRVFDAGIGDGSVLTRVMREMHWRFTTLPFYIAGKEISLEDVRLALSRMADRFFEHPSTVLVLTNMYYSEAPWLRPADHGRGEKQAWKEISLFGSTAHDFEDQINDLDDFLVENWQARHSPKSGNPIYERPAVLVIYREDYKFLLHEVIPEQGKAIADFDLVIASQPYRARVPTHVKTQQVLLPLTRALRTGGRMIGIHSYGNDPGMEIIRKVWPEEDPFTPGRRAILRQLRKDLGDEAKRYIFHPFPDSRSIFRYEMHTLPTEVYSSIGTSTLFAAWNDAVYVAQIEDERIEAQLHESKYLDATREVMQDQGGLWFQDESYVVFRKY